VKRLKTQNIPTSTTTARCSETPSNVIAFVCIVRVIGLQYILSGSGIGTDIARSSFHTLFALAASPFPIAVSPASANDKLHQSKIKVVDT
jgi:hypothetical protein